MSKGDTGSSVSSGVIPADQIDREAPLTLQAAADHAFPDGTMTVRILRAERDRGRLDTWIIGKREYTTLAAISRMIEACRAAQKPRVSTYVKDAAASPPGSYSIEERQLALAMARASAQRLRENSRAASRKSGSKQSGKAIRQK